MRLRMIKVHTIKETRKIKELLELIKANYYKPQKNNSCYMYEVNLKHVVNRINNVEIKNLVEALWLDIEFILGYEIRLLETIPKSNFFRKIFKKKKSMYFIRVGQYPN